MYFFKVGAIIGGVIGGLVGLLLILLAIGLVIYFVRRSKNNRKFENAYKVNTSNPPLNMTDTGNLNYIVINKIPSPLTKIRPAETENLSYTETSSTLPQLLSNRNNLINYTVLSPATLNEISNGSSNQITK